MNNIRTLQIVVTISAAVLAIIHQFWPNLIKFDTPTLTLLVIAVIPWLQPLVKSIELLGLKLELQDLKEEIADAKGASESAKQQAFLAQTLTANPAELKLRETASVEAQLDNLANQYEKIRHDQSSGDTRTIAMTQVVHQMMTAYQRGAVLDVKEALESNRPGMRLAAYAALNVKPDASLLREAVKSISHDEKTPFGHSEVSWQ